MKMFKINLDFAHVILRPSEKGMRTSYFFLVKSEELREKSPLFKLKVLKRIKAAYCHAGSIHDLRFTIYNSIENRGNTRSLCRFSP